MCSVRCIHILQPSEHRENGQVRLRQDRVAKKRMSFHTAVADFVCFSAICEYDLVQVFSSDLFAAFPLCLRECLSTSASKVSSSLAKKRLRQQREKAPFCCTSCVGQLLAFGAIAKSE